MSNHKAELMKRYVLILALIASVAISCKEDKLSIACNVDDPAENLSWMQEVIEEYTGTEIGRLYTYIQKADYDGQTVFIVQNCCPMCSFMPVVYKCDGSRIPSKDLDFKKLSTREVVWKSSENTCILDK